VPFFAGGVRLVHRRTAAGAVDQPAKEGFHPRAVTVVAGGGILFQTRLNEIEGMLVDDGLMLAGIKFAVDRNPARVQDVGLDVRPV